MPTRTRSWTRLWQTVLLHQFHDILPGTSIAWVHREAERAYAAVAETLEKVITRSLRRLAGEGDTALAFNAGPYPLDGVASLGGSAAVVRGGVTAAAEAGGFRLENEFVRVTVDERGLITSIRDLVADREVVPPGESANLLQLFRDVPTTWDAWNIDEQYAHGHIDLVDADSVTITEETAERVTVRVIRSFGSLLDRAGRQPRRPLHGGRHRHAGRLARAAEAAETRVPARHSRRPGGIRDSVRACVPAHAREHVVGSGSVRDGRASVGARGRETGYGVAVANDATYGHDISRATRPHGGTTTTCGCPCCVRRGIRTRRPIRVSTR